MFILVFLLMAHISFTTLSIVLQYFSLNKPNIKTHFYQQTSSKEAAFPCLILKEGELHAR